MYQLSSLQAARGLAALAVLAFHSLFINAKYVQGESLLPEAFAFGQTGVDLFFSISGFVMTIAFRDKFGVKGEIFNFLINRFFRIYPIYWVYFAAIFLVFKIRPEIINSSQNGDVNLIASFFLLPYSALPLLMVAWTLIHEVWFYLVFAAIMLLPRKWVFGALMTWLTTIICISLLTNTPSNSYLRIMTHEFSLEFIFGALAGLAYLKLVRRPINTSAPVIALLLSGLGGVAYALVTDVVDVTQSISLERTFVVGGSYTVLLLAFALQESRNRLSVPSFFKSIGDMSYSLYLSHVLTLSVCGRAWQSLDNAVSGIWGAIIFWGISYAAVLIVAYLSYKLIEKPIMNFVATYRNNRLTATLKKEGGL